MFKEWWNKIKDWVLSKIEEALLKEVEKLDRYEDDLANLIREKVNPDERAKQLVDYVQEKLSELVVKTFDSKWLSRSFFESVEKSILKEITHLDKYEDDLATIIRKRLNPEEKAALVVGYVQEYLTALIKKYIQKI